MRVVFEDEVRNWPRTSASGDGSPCMSCLVDLHFSCNVRCRGCDPGGGVALTGSAARRLLDGVVERAGEHGASRLDLAFFGGEPLLEANLVLELSTQLRRECEYERIGYAGHLLTNGTLLGAIAPSRLAGAGLRRIQVTLEGGPREHDQRRRMRDGGGSWRRIVEGLKRIRGVAEVVVRSNIDRLTPDVEDLLGALDGEGLLGPDGVVALLVARPAPYAEQARDLLRIFPLLRERASETESRLVH